MLTRQTRRSNDWHDFYDRQTVEDCAMNPDGSFICVGMGYEPEYQWDEDAGEYNTDQVISQGIWVAQDYVDKNTGEHSVQNPVLVRVSDPNAPEINFNDHIKFTGLLGYYSRKSKKCSFRADLVQKVEDDAE